MDIKEVATNMMLNDVQIKEEKLAEFFMFSSMEEFEELLQLPEICKRIKATERHEGRNYQSYDLVFSGWNEYQHKYTVMWRVFVSGLYDDWNPDTRLNKVMFETTTEGAERITFRATQEIFDWEASEDEEGVMQESDYLNHGI